MIFLSKTSTPTRRSSASCPSCSIVKTKGGPEAAPARSGTASAPPTRSRGRYSPSMRQNLDLQDLWELAIRQAAADLEVHGETVRPGLPARCPFGLGELVQRDFDPRAAISRLADLPGTSTDGDGQSPR